MSHHWKIGVLAVLGLILGCKQAGDESKMTDTLDLPVPMVVKDSSKVKTDTSGKMVSKIAINTGNVQPGQLVEFAKTLIGVRYKYGSTDPRQGFDCSGFITHVFNHFDIAVPRSSIDFTDVGRTVPYDSAKAGDLILFTGTDSTEQHVGHMGIVVANNNGKAEFIHSTSGKQYGVTITPLNSYYMSRYVRTARIFRQNE
jgi:cell wall-associated NlpC family hydrolase